MSSRIGFLLLVSVSLASAGCRGLPRSGPSAPPQRFDPASERAAVYAAVLRQIVGREGAGRYVVEPMSQEGESAGADRLRGLRPDTLQAFAEAHSGERLPLDLDAGGPLDWFSLADWPGLAPESASAQDHWVAFHERFPDAFGRTTLSQVGFSRDGTQALTWLWHGRASLDSYRMLVLLERRMAGWRVVDTATTSIS